MGLGVAANAAHSTVSHARPEPLFGLLDQKFSALRRNPPAGALPLRFGHVGACLPILYALSKPASSSLLYLLRGVLLADQIWRDSGFAILRRQSNARLFTGLSVGGPAGDQIQDKKQAHASGRAMALKRTSARHQVRD